MPAASISPSDTEILARWRLVLGRDAERHCISCGGDSRAERIESLIGFLFGDGEGGREGDADGQGLQGRAGRGSAGQSRSGSREGGTGGSTLTVPDWVDAVAELFPREAKEVMEREFVARRGLREILEQPELLERVEPNVDLVKTLLTHKDLLNENTRVLARKIIEKVVEQLKDKLRLQVETALTGAIRRDRHSPRKVFRNLDIKTTLRRNLKNYDRDREQLLVDRVYYYAAERKKRPWHIIVTVDQSGSMLDSAIFSAAMASIFYELPSIKTSLVLFDTQVVDLSNQVGQPVDVLLSIQLGGGTDITQALMYSQQLAREPARAIVVLVTDFFEGRDERDLVTQVKEMADCGIRMIGLGALGYDARPAYNKPTARKCRKAGMDILVCTPERLAECMARIIRG